MTNKSTLCYNIGMNRVSSQFAFKSIRKALLEATGFRCSKCGRWRGSRTNCTLHIHHKDGGGYGVTETPNNRLDNLIVLCAQCHQLIHYNNPINSKYRDTLILHLNREGLTFREIGKILNISKQRVHQLYTNTQT